MNGGVNMDKQVMIQVRMDNELKCQAKEVFDKLGIDLSTAARMFLKAAVREQGLPINTSVKGTIKKLP